MLKNVKKFDKSVQKGTQTVRKTDGRTPIYPTSNLVRDDKQYEKGLLNFVFSIKTL